MQGEIIMFEAFAAFKFFSDMGVEAAAFSSNDRSMADDQTKNMAFLYAFQLPLLLNYFVLTYGIGMVIIQVANAMPW